MYINTLHPVRLGLKIPRPQGRESSILSFGTNDLAHFPAVSRETSVVRNLADLFSYPR